MAIEGWASHLNSTAAAAAEAAAVLHVALFIKPT
jgi:hypothetical protein